MSQNPEELDLVKSRLTTVETLLTHLERDVRDLDQVLLEQGKQLVLIRQEISKLAAALEAVRSGEDEPRIPEDEIPPHY